MANSEAIILRDRLSEHPAFLAWRQLCPSSLAPDSIELLKGEKRKSAVYRLSGMHGVVRQVIAKRRGIGELAVEARIYLEVLEPLALQTLEFYGQLEDFAGDSWLFLEDAGDAWYSPDTPAHRKLAIDWMTRLHSTPPARISWLADCGPSYFSGVLEAARQAVRGSVVHPSIDLGSRARFKALLDSLDKVEAEWADIEQICALAPRTLVHGDFVPKNVRVRGAGINVHLIAFDWETAGVGCAAGDIALIPGGRSGCRTYFEMLRDVWPELTLDSVVAQRRVGEIFRLLHCIQWESRSFAHAWVERAIRNMVEYERALRKLTHNGLQLHA